MSVGRAIERTQTIVGLTAVLAMTLPGCGPAPSAPSSSTGSTASPAAGRGAAEGGGRESAADGERQVAEHTDAQGRKWLGDVPYDVFFDDPVSVAAEGRSANRGKPEERQPQGTAPVAARENPRASQSKSGTSLAEAAPTASGKPRPGPSKKSGGSATDWSALIDPETLDAEVKQIRTELTAGLQSVGKYNSRYQEIAVSGSTLAALAEIVSQSPRSVSWKEHAANARDLAAAIHDSAKALGSQAYQTTKNSSDQLMDVLDGNLPAGLPTSEPTRDFAQVANRGALMKRMDRSFQRLKKGGTAQQLLKKDAAQAIEDAAILGVLSRVIAVGHYDSADDPKYREQAADLTRAASDLTTSAKSGEAPAFADALTLLKLWGFLRQWDFGRGHGGGKHRDGGRRPRGRVLSRCEKAKGIRHV
jgi:hypothetical protein